MVREKLGCLRLRGVLAFSVVALAVRLALVPVALGQDNGRKVTARTAPTYPELAKKMHLSGKVKVEVAVSSAGTVTSAKLVGGNPRVRVERH